MPKRLAKAWADCSAQILDRAYTPIGLPSLSSSTGMEEKFVSPSANIIPWSQVQRRQGRLSGCEHAEEDLPGNFSDDDSFAHCRTLCCKDEYVEKGPGQSRSTSCNRSRTYYEIHDRRRLRLFFARFCGAFPAQAEVVRGRLIFKV